LKGEKREGKAKETTEREKKKEKRKGKEK